MLDFLFGRRDPTRHWRRADNLKLHFALDMAKLNDAALGSLLDEASFLGPAEDRRAARQGIFCYHSLGACIGSEGGPTITSLEVISNDDAAEFQPFCGRTTFRGADVDLAGMSVDAFLQTCGECYWRDVDEDETILFYEFPGREWQVEFDELGRFKRLQVNNQPLMADKRQRDAYGVTAAWPPANATG